MAHIDTSLMEQVMDVAQREPKVDRMHHAQTNNFERLVEEAEGAFRHAAAAKIGAGQLQANLV